MQLTDPSHTKKERGFFATLHALSAFEKLLYGILFLCVLISGTYLVQQKNSSLLVTIPRVGGAFRESIVGIPRFINPVLASSQADKDLTALVYTGLMTRDTQGNPLPSLAESYTISEDGTIYTFVLKKNLTFHDGVPLTARDVVYTIKQIQNPAVRSPLFSVWNNIHAENPDDTTVIFTLPTPYAPFLEQTTLGILPEHIWGSLSAEEFSFSDRNVNPVGAGAYQMETIERDTSGIPTRYTLRAFTHYVLGAPYIQTFVCILFKNTEDALQAFLQKEVDGVDSIPPSRYQEEQEKHTLKTAVLVHTPLLRTFDIFFNHNKQPLFLEDSVREALSLLTPKQTLVQDILKGYGTVLETPLIPKEAIEAMRDADREAGARTILEKAGWARNAQGIYARTDKNKKETTLSFTLTTIDIPELADGAKRIAEAWRTFGIDCTVNIFDVADFSQTVLRPRKYEALFFGLHIGHERDLYTFWHSSERNDPGLNLAQFADIKTDALLETLRKTTDKDAYSALAEQIATSIAQEHASIFVYAPEFLYLTSTAVHNVSLHPLAEQDERFDSVHTWYVETDSVWPIRTFVKQD